MPDGQDESRAASGPSGSLVSLWMVPSRPHLAFPVALAPGGGFATVEQDSDEDVANSIAIILSWPAGTRRGQPDFGVQTQAFESGGPRLDEIRHAVIANESRAQDATDKVIEQGFDKAIVQVSFDQGAAT